MHHPLRTVIVGAAGYTGAELASLLAAHPACEIVGVFGSEKRAAEGEQPLSRLFPRLRGVVDLPLRVASVQAIVDLKPNVVFLCTPHEVSAAMSEALLAAELVVIDLSAAFRLHNAADYPTHYGFEHPAAHLLQRAVYGLPEFNRARIAESDLIACPGCYPTSVALALKPLAAANLIRTDRPVIVDSASGVSGAGRSPAVKSLFCEVSFQPYNALKHRHQPEMRQETGCTVLFTPHLLPLDRGIVSTIHAELADGVTEAQVRAWLQRIYEGESFVRLLPAGEWPSVGGVERTNFCDIGLAVDEATRHLLLVSSIDNLVKGASGQAVQCMNVRFGLPETMGLLAEFSEQMQ
ncbi:MAG: N-acetyl-gamma-glutamyl-phosphate reductase [Phycisphaerales bacterium]|jgi:N-acetyl-gamma-glutamyl-phosphate reductase